MMQNQQSSHILSYGDHPEQRVILKHPQTQLSKGTAVLVHGGYWRQRISATVMHPMFEALLQSGWSVANVEYRRGPEHAWPIPAVDVAVAIELVKQTLCRQELQDFMVLVGHSVGGQLALLNADLADAAIGLAPVTDATKVFQEDLGESAAIEYFRNSPVEVPDIYRQASPCAQPSPQVPLLLVHGQDDDRVPLEHTKQYVNGLSNSVQHTTIFPQQLDHFEIIDPEAHHWDIVRAWMDQVSANARAE